MAFTLQGLARVGLCFRAIDEIDHAKAMLGAVSGRAERHRQPATQAYTLHHLARIDLADGRWESARERNDRARQVASNAGFQALDFDLDVLDIRASASAGDTSAALTLMARLGNGDRLPNEAAALLYERWLVTRSDDDRQQAAAVYRRRHAEAPSANTARRLGHLTGATPTLPRVQSAGSEPPPAPAFFGLLD